MTNSRAKGARAERELFAILSAELGTVCNRNLSQTRGGGADCIDVPGWAIEVKRCEREELGKWWEQTISQANGSRPILFYRASRKPWAAMLDLADIAHEKFPVGGRETAIVSVTAAIQVMRESMTLTK